MNVQSIPNSPSPDGWCAVPFPLKTSVIYKLGSWPQTFILSLTLWERDRFFVFPFSSIPGLSCAFFSSCLVGSLFFATH